MEEAQSPRPEWGPFVSNLSSTGRTMVVLRPAAEGGGRTRPQALGGLWQEATPAPCPWNL